MKRPDYVVAFAGGFVSTLFGTVVVATLGLAAHFLWTVCGWWFAVGLCWFALGGLLACVFERRRTP